VPVLFQYTLHITVVSVNLLRARRRSPDLPPFPVRITAKSRACAGIVFKTHADECSITRYIYIEV
jgi:hypothetical protein